MKRARGFRTRGSWKGRQIAGSTCAVVLAGLMYGCSPKAPQVPSTDWTIRIPVADDRTSIQEEVQDRSDYLKIDEDGTMGLKINAEINRREEIGDRLRVTPQGQSFDTPIGDIAIPGQDIPEINIVMSDLLGQELPETGIAIDLPAFDIEDQTVELELGGVESLTVKEGGIDVIVDNGLPMPLEVILTLVDLDSGETIAELDGVGRIEAESQATGEFDLDDATISGNLGIVVRGGTAEADDVIISGDPSLDIQASLRPLIVDEAVAVIPEQQFGASQVLEFPDDRIQIDRAVISQGGLELRVVSDLPVVMSVTLRLDDLKDSSGNPMELVIPELRPGEADSHRFVLDGREFVPADPLELQLSYEARTFDSGTPVSIKSGGVISVEAITEDLVFGLVEGKLNRLEVPIPQPEPVNRDFPDGVENLALAAAELTVYITSGVGFQSEIELNIQGTNKAGQSRTLIVKEVFERGDPDLPKTIVVAPPPGELTDFLNLLPSEIVVTPKVLVGDGVDAERVRVQPSDWVRVDSVVFETAAKFSILADDQLRPDPELQELEDDEARERIRNNLKKATVITAIENHIPLAVRVSLLVAKNPEDVYDNPDLTIPTDGEPFGVEAAPVDPATGRVTRSIKADLRTVGLTQDEVRKLLPQEGGVYTGVLVEFDATDGDVELLGTDWISVQAATEIVIELNKSLVE